MTWPKPRGGTLKTVILIASLAFNIGVCMALGKQAYEHYCSPERGRFSHVGDLYKQLHLTDVQETAMHESKHAMFEDLRKLRTELGEANEQLVNLVAQSESDQDAVAEQIGRIADIRAATQQRMVEHFLEVKQTLEPDQLEAYGQIIRHWLSHSSGAGRWSGRGRPGSGKWDSSRQRRHAPGADKSTP